MSPNLAPAPDHTAVRVALWRAMHLQVDAAPHIFEDDLGLRIAAPDAGWRDRPDMNSANTAAFRGSIVARARFIEDLVMAEAARGVRQYVILGAGLDTFAQRRKDAASGIHVFEVDRPSPQAWKRQRLIELGFGVPEWLRFVPVDFEGGASQWDELAKTGFDPSQPAVVASSGVSMYLTREANLATLRQISTLAPGSTLAMTFMPPMEQLEPDDRRAFAFAEHGARAAGTQFLSFFTPDEMVALARDAGFREAREVSATTYHQRLFRWEERWPAVIGWRVAARRDHVTCAQDWHWVGSTPRALRVTSPPRPFAYIGCT